MHIVAWWPGLKKVSLAHLLTRELGITVAEAKGVVDLILVRSDFGMGTTESNATGLVSLREPVVVPVPNGADATVLKRQLEEVGLVLDTSASQA